MNKENRTACAVCIITPDNDLTLEEMNDKSCEMLGYFSSDYPDSLRGLLCEEDFCEFKKAIGKAFAEGREESRHELKARNCQGELCWLRADCYYEAGKPEKVICALTDITSYKKEAEFLGKKEEELLFALRRAGIFLASYSIAEHILYLSTSAAEVFHLPGIIHNMPESLLNGRYMSKEDEDRFKKFFHMMAEGVPSASTVVQIEWRTGERQWIRGFYSLTETVADDSLRSMIVFENITKQKNREVSYQQWYQLFERQVMDSMLYYEYNLTEDRLLRLKGRIQTELPPGLKRSFTDMTAYTADTFVYTQDKEAYLRAFNRDRILESFFKGQRELHFEYRREMQDGSNVWVMAAIHTIQDLDSDDVKCYVLIKNIDNQKRRQLALTEKSRKDSLTHVFNRGMGTEIMIRMLKKQPEQPALFYIMDIDNFKYINDTHGHISGDEVLKRTAEALSGLIRKRDIICRFGGDEFVLFLRDLKNSGDAKDIGEISRLGESIGKRMNQRIREGCGITVSIGGAVYPHHGRTLAELYKCADTMLYEVKNNGGDWCRIYDDSLKAGNEKQGRGIQELDRYRGILPDSFDELIEYNFTTDHFRRIYLVKKNYMAFQAEGDGFEDVLSDIAAHVLHPDDASRFLKFCDLRRLKRRFELGESQISEEFRIRFYNAGYGWICLSVRPAESLSEDVIWLFAVSDIDIRKMADEVEEKNREIFLKQMEAERYQIIMEQTGTIVIDYDFLTGMSYMADGARQFTFSENIEKRDYNHFIRKGDVYGDDWDRLVLLLREIHSGASQGGALIRFKKKDGNYLWCRLNVTMKRDKDGHVLRSVATLNDVDEAMKDKTSLAYKEEYDELTGYANYSRFKREAGQILTGLHSSGYVLWYLNIRNFKLVNDLCGYEVGNSLLWYAARAISNSLKTGETFARSNSDHFTVLKKWKTKEELDQWFYEILDKVRMFERTAGSRITLDISGGAYLIEPGEQMPAINEIIERANIAQDSAKSSRKTGYVIYSDEQRQVLLYEKRIAAEMHRALTRKEFKMYLQPIARITGPNKLEVAAAEVLVRWKAADGNIRMPSEFIPLFEENGFIIELDAYMMEETCAYIRKNIALVPEGFHFCVNASRVSIMQDDFIERYAGLKKKYGIPDGMVTLECTETTVAKSIDLLASFAQKLREQGFFFSLDDFGAGYSSLNVLKDVHADTVKLDRIFLLNGLDNARDRIVISSIIQMAGALDMNVLAEGVETEKQLIQLAKLGCGWIQGYLLSRPVPAEKFWDLEVLRYQYPHI